MSDGRSCMDHKIPTWGGRLYTMVGAVGKWLMLCGGYDYKDCRKLDMTQASPSWAAAPELPYNNRHGVMHSYGGYIYVIYGYVVHYGCRNWHYRLAENGNSWQSRASHPISTYGSRSVVDEPNGRVFTLGGHDCSNHRSEVYYYTFSTNQWTHHSNMPRARYYKSATIIKQKNGERWLMSQDRDYVELYYYNLDQNSGWHHVTNQPFKQSHYMFMVSVTPYTAFMMGAWTNVRSTSRQNFWSYNPEHYKFESINRNIQTEHSYGYWTTTAKNWTVLNNCNAERTYVAVGWGGDHGYVSFSTTMRNIISNIILHLHRMLSGVFC